VPVPVPVPVPDLVSRSPLGIGASELADRYRDRP
jgi:hypothetical protein